MKKLALLICLIIFCSSCLTAYACCSKFFHKKIEVNNEIIQDVNKTTETTKSETEPVVIKQADEQSVDFEILPTMNSDSNAKNQVWVGTFQLIWNDLIDNIVKHDVEFVGYHSIMAENLNKKSFGVNDISEKSYYKAWGLVSPEMKKEIENGIKEKFNETSDILGGLDWTPAPDKYILYAMLKKDFEYIEILDKLPNGNFYGSEKEVKYFGVDNNSTYKQRSSINVLFYNGANDYAVTLKSKQGDIVTLYRVNEDKTLQEYYEDMLKKSSEYSGSKYLASKDRFKAPVIDFKSERTFKELCNKLIKNSDFMISQAIETIQFKMDEAGVKLKSEAAMIVGCTSVMMPEPPRYFYFDNKYVIFLSEEGKKPYFGIKISDAAKLQN